MDPVDLGESDLLVDLENGQPSFRKDMGEDILLNAINVKKLSGRTWSGYLDLDKASGSRDCLCSSSGVLSSGETSDASVEILLDKLGKEAVEKTLVKEKRKKSYKKPPKPPKPPRGPSLDAADMRFVKEISEFAMLKRARLERMKTMKKSKADKTSSSMSNFLAMFITIIFFFVLLFQGLLGSRV